MLKELKIENFALIDNITVEFTKGFNVLTGETGAGKSLLLDSIGLLCGNRANSTFIRKGADKAIVEGVFDLNDDILLRLNNLDYLEIEDSTMLMSRELAINGGNKCKINYRTVPLNIYKEFGEILFEIHAQNQEQSIMDKVKQLDLLDKYVLRDEDIKDIFKEVELLSSRYKDLDDKLRNLNNDENTKNDLIEYYRYAIKEINDANIEPLEDEKLKEERNIIANSERLVKNSNLINEDFSINIIDGLNRALHNLSEIERIDNKVEDIYKRVENIYYEAEDISNTFKNYSQSLEFDESRLNEIEIRLSQINRIKNKYGNTLAEVFLKLRDMESELETWENKSINLDKINTEIKEVRRDYFLKANELLEVRKKGALEIENIIKEKLGKLSIYKDGFKIMVNKNDYINKKGSVDVEFLFSGNKGEELLPLKKVASGGEVSRIMLAFKEFFSELDFIPTLIFDEIDSGIGGETLLKIAEALNLIGSKRQVICVTHSPIIAAFADRIILVKKVEEKDRMIVDLVPLVSEDEVIEELSRMLGGDKNFSTAKKQSLEMLKFAKEKKKV